MPGVGRATAPPPTVHVQGDCAPGPTGHEPGLQQWQQPDGGRGAAGREDAGGGGCSQGLGSSDCPPAAPAVAAAATAPRAMAATDAAYAALTLARVSMARAAAGLRPSLCGAGSSEQAWQRGYGAAAASPPHPAAQPLFLDGRAVVAPATEDTPAAGPAGSAEHAGAAAGTGAPPPPAAAAAAGTTGLLPGPVPPWQVPQPVWLQPPGGPAASAAAAAAGPPASAAPLPPADRTALRAALAEAVAASYRAAGASKQLGSRSVALPRSRPGPPRSAAGLASAAGAECTLAPAECTLPQASAPAAFMGPSVPCHGTGGGLAAPATTVGARHDGAGPLQPSVRLAVLCGQPGACPAPPPRQPSHGAAACAPAAGKGGEGNNGPAAGAVRAVQHGSPSEAAAAMDELEQLLVAAAHAAASAAAQQLVGETDSGPKVRLVGGRGRLPCCGSGQGGTRPLLRWLVVHTVYIRVARSGLLCCRWEHVVDLDLVGVRMAAPLLGAGPRLTCTRRTRTH